MKRTLTLSSLLFAGVLLAGCSTNGSSSSPTVNQANLNSNTLQFAVGTANYGPNNIVALNTVVTYRQPNGLSAVLVDTPTITGPAGFVVPQSSLPPNGGGGPGTDAGTNHISGTPQQTAPGSANTTFGQNGGAFSYGFGPFNIAQFGSATYPGKPPLYLQPFYLSGINSSTTVKGKLRFVGGPPAYPFFNDGTFPAGFQGYSQGFTMFANTGQVPGQYSLSVLVPAQNAPQVTATAVGTLSNTAPLASYTLAPTFTQDGAGGGSGTVVIPPDSNITETMVYIVDYDAGNYFTVGPIGGTGPQAFTLPANLGPCGSANCQNTSGKSAPTIAAGNRYRIYAVSYNYPMFEASPPGNKAPNPTIVGADGQADITVSPVNNVSGGY